ncbi:hypothetical protein ACIOJE_37545 [Kitasatospora sp. NPDC087861]|uniref:hypothetical protein n=1 Tax=Kitasatospora sp. NPDC087861 TaxID=3364070 RepID=UPI0038283EF2
MDQLVVDGWYTKDAADKPAVEVNGGGQPVQLRVAPHHENPGDDGPPQRHTFGGQGLKDYVSRIHVADHLLDAFPGRWLAADPQDLR